MVIKISSISLNATSLRNMVLTISKPGLGSSSYSTQANLIFSKAEDTPYNVYTFPAKSGVIALLNDSPFDVFTISTVSVSGSITWVCWEDPAKQEYIWRQSSSSINFEVKDTNNNQIQVSKGDSYFSIKGKFLAIYSKSTITPSTAHSYSTIIGKSTSSTTFYTGANNIINSFQFNLNTGSDSFWTPSSDPSVVNVGETAMVEVGTTFQFSPITFIKLKE